MQLETNPPLNEEAKAHLAQCNDDESRNKTFLELFKEYFASVPDAFAKAGGRVNLIGEHVDYPGLQFSGDHPSHLMSMGGSIQNSFLAALHIRDDQVLKLQHLEARESFSLELKDLLPLETKSVQEREDQTPMEQRSVPDWAHHSLACLRELHRVKPLDRGMEVLLSSNVPHGAGMSNSAANCVALTLCFKKAFKLSTLNEPQTIVDFARTSERSDYVGGQCGYLDQMLIVHSQEAQLTALDYVGNQVSHFTSSLGPPWQFVAINTQVPHVLAESDYTHRVQELEIGISLMRKVFNKEIGSTFLSLTSYDQLLHELAQTPSLQLPLEDKGYSIPEDAIPSMVEELLKNYQPPTCGDHPTLSPKESLALLLKRMRHQKSSSLIVPEAGRLAQKGDAQGFGRLLDAEGKSLRMNGDFQITGSNGAQDALLDAGFQAGEELDVKVHGRMLGGGGGGNVLFLVKRDNEKLYQDWLTQTKNIYKQWSSKAFDHKGIEATVIEPTIGPGAYLI